MAIGPGPQPARSLRDSHGCFALIRWLSPPGLSLTSAGTLATLERSGPCRLTALAASERVTQPAMTQLVGRLADSGLVARSADPDDGRVVYVQLTPQGRDLLARRRAIRAERLSRLLARLSQADQDALAAALPAMNALASVQRDEQLVRPAGSAATASPRTRTLLPELGRRAHDRQVGWCTQDERDRSQPLPAAESSLRGCVRLRRFVHGYRPGRPDPARHLSSAACLAERGHPAVH